MIKILSTNARNLLRSLNYTEALIKFALEKLPCAKLHSVPSILIANIRALFTKLGILLHVAILNKSRYLHNRTDFAFIPLSGHAKFDPWIFLFLFHGNDRQNQTGRGVCGHKNFIKLYLDFGHRSIC